MVTDDLTAARKYIERLYFDKCSIVAFEHVTENNLTYVKEVVVGSDIPCHLSHMKKTVESAEEGVAAGIQLFAWLHLSPDIEVKPGSKITVTRNGRSKVYKNSGEPVNYLTHQELALELDDERA